MKNKTYYLLDDLPNAVITAPQDNYIEIQRISIQRQPYNVLLQHPDSKVIFPKIKIIDHGQFSSAVTLNPQIIPLCVGKISFRLSLLTVSNSFILKEMSLESQQIDEKNPWIPFEVDLNAWVGQTIQIVLETQVKGSGNYAWSLWNTPEVITGPDKGTSSIRSQKSFQHVFIISADALSKRWVGVYGSDEGITPNIDEFSKNASIFEGACSESTLTLGAYMSMLSGLHPNQHGVKNEWGVFPKMVQNLPQYFASRGYGTVLISSEAEFGLPDIGIGNLFQKNLRPRCNPVQDGSITLRTFERYWKEPKSKPMFTVLQFFDTHPPNLTPPTFAKKFYDQDPSKIEVEAFKIKGIYGIESLGAIDTYLAGNLPSDFFPFPLYTRLEDTAKALIGENQVGPDLWIHITHIGKSIWIDESSIQTGHWILEQLRIIRGGQSPTSAFLDWMHRLKGHLAFIQNGILSWLDNVSDFRYAVEQYKASLHYFDSLFGSFINVLKRSGDYDDSLIVFTAPHGEILEYEDLYFHHHMPHPHVFDVPLLVKQPLQTNSIRIQGMVEHRDLFPSLVEGIWKEECAFGGTSWWKNVNGNGIIKKKYSVGVDESGAITSVYQPPYMFVQAHQNYQISKSIYGYPKDAFLYKMEGNQLVRIYQRDKIEEMKQYFSSEFPNGLASQ